MKVEDEVELAHVAEVAVQNLDVVLDHLDAGGESNAVRKGGVLTRESPRAEW